MQWKAEVNVNKILADAQGTGSLMPAGIASIAQAVHTEMAPLVANPLLCGECDLNLLERYLEDLVEVEGADDFNWVMGWIYDWADANAVWMGV